MNSYVPEQVLKMAEYCPHGFTCLSSGRFGDETACRARYIDGENILFLTSNEERNCPYRASYGYCQVCRCPVRYFLCTSQ